MALVLRKIYKNTEWLYQVCEVAETGEPVIEVVIPGLGWYSLYFRLTPEQADLVNTDKDALTRLARSLSADKGRRRFRAQLIDLADYGGEVEFLPDTGQGDRIGKLS